MIVSRRVFAGRTEFFAVLIGLIVVTTGGCSKPGSDVIVCAEAPKTADEAVRNVLAGLQRQELQALWEFLPPSYQADVQELLHDLGERLDEKSWEPFVATCRKAHTVTSQIVRKFNEASEAANASDRELAAHLRAVEQLLSALCESELNNVVLLRKLDALRFLGGTGNRLIAALSQGALGDTGLGGDLFAQFGEVKVELLESTTDSAVLAVLTVQWPGQAATQHKFVRVEQHWIPQTLAEAWPTQFPLVREQCLAWADELRAHPEPWHARLREIDQLLDELAETKSFAETRQVWQTGALRLAAAWFGTAIPDQPQSVEVPIVTPPSSKPIRVKRPDTEVLLPDEPQK